MTTEAEFRIYLLVMLDISHVNSQRPTAHSVLLCSMHIATCLDIRCASSRQTIYLMSDRLLRLLNDLNIVLLLFKLLVIHSITQKP